MHYYKSTLKTHHPSLSLPQPHIFKSVQILSTRKYDTALEGIITVQRIIHFNHCKLIIVKHQCSKKLGHKTTIQLVIIQLLLILLSPFNERVSCCFISSLSVCLSCIQRQWPLVLFIFTAYLDDDYKFAIIYRFDYNYYSLLFRPTTPDSIDQ